MKKIKILFVLAGLISLGFLTGCATTNGTGVDQQTLNDSAIILRNAARNASALAISKKDDNKKYVQLAVATLDTFLVGNDYTPGALTKALEPLIKEVKTVEVNLAINTVIDLYEVFYGRYVKSKVAANENALLFLKALRDGAQQGLTAALPAS